MNNISTLYELINSPGWRQLAADLQVHMNQLAVKLISLDRDPKVADDFLRGQIAAFLWVIELEKRVNREIAEKLADKPQDNPEEPAVGSPYERQADEKEETTA